MTRKEAITIAHQFLNETTSPGPTDPNCDLVLDGALLRKMPEGLAAAFSYRPASEHSREKWYLWFKIILPPDYVESPGRILILVDPVHGFEEQYPLM